MAERIQKVLANLGIGSRRQIEAMIREGRIEVNGKTATLGDRMEGDDRVKIDGKQLKSKHRPATKTKVLAYYKPAGEICTRNDPGGRTTVFERIPKLKNGRWINIGRLDINTTGLLLFSNDGELANRLMHPSSRVEREYAVRVLGTASAEQMQAMRDGVRLEDGVARFSDIVDGGGEGSNHWYYVVVMEGRNREVRRLWESQGLAVSRLIRTRFGPYLLPRKKRKGQYWDLDEKEIQALYDEVTGDAEG